MRQTLSVRGAVAFFVLTGVAGLTVNFLRYGGRVGVHAALALLLYGFPLVLSAVLIAVPRTRRWVREAVLVTAYFVCGGDILKLFFWGSTADARLWAIVVPACGAIVVGAVAHRAREVMYFGAYCTASVGIAWALDAVTAANAIGVGVRLRSERDLLRVDDELRAALRGATPKRRCAPRPTFWRR